jgi:large subunit ribosomal protein L9
MQVILLERIPRLGQMGDEVKVKDGFARNFLLPQGKALRANVANRAKFENQRADLEARNLERRTEASAVHDKLDGTSYVVIRSAGETGQLYGSVSTRDIAQALEENGFKVNRTQINLNLPIKTIGLHTVTVQLHPEVSSKVTVNVARSADEAERQTKGEDLTKRSQFEFEELPEEEEAPDLSGIFEESEEQA